MGCLWEPARAGGFEGTPAEACWLVAHGRCGGTK